MEAGQLEEKQESSARKQSDHVTNGRLAELDQLVLEKRSTLERLPDKDSEEAKALQEQNGQSVNRRKGRRKHRRQSAPILSRAPREQLDERAARTRRRAKGRAGERTEGQS